MPTLYLIDGYAQFFRAYHAIRSPMSSPVTKEPTNMTFGFIGMLLKLLRGEGRISADAGTADYIAVALDVSGDRETFRSTLYPEYKANRSPPPNDLFPQVERCLTILRTMGVPVLGEAGFEADDVIATVVKQLRTERPDVRVRFISKDKDLKQLLFDPPAGAAAASPIEMYDIHTDELMTESRLMQETGITPAQVIEMLALMGDTVDNVPGVEGVGPKTAAQLIAQYGSIENLLKHANEIKGKRGEALRATADKLALSRILVTLRDDVPVRLDLDAASRATFKLDTLMPTLRELGFNRYQDELKLLMGGGGGVGGEAGDKAGPDAAGSSAAPKTASTSMYSFTDATGREAPPGSTPRKPPPPPSASASSALTRKAPKEITGGLFDSIPGEGSSAGASAASSAPTSIAGADYRCITTREQLDELVAQLRTAPVIAIDTETTHLSPLRCKLCGISISIKAHTGFYIPVRSPACATHLDEAAVLAALRPILEDPTRPKTGHNLKYDMLVFRRCGIMLRGLGFGAKVPANDPSGAPIPSFIDSSKLSFDSMIASYLIDASRSSHSLDSLALALLGRTNISIKELIGHGKDQRTFDTVPLDQAACYAAEDADVAFQLREIMEPQLNAMGLMDLFARVELPLVEVLAELEWNGILVDPSELERQRSRLQTRIDELRKKIDETSFESLGRTFNPDSPKQLAAALFNRRDDEESGLGLKSIKKTKTGHSTDIEVLEKLSQDATITTPIPNLIVEYRQLTKLVGTYLVALVEEINPETRRIHSSFNQTVAVTGRLASSDPNLQNIPIRTEVGREIRRAFVAAPGPPPCVLVSADYSQIELRLLAHLSRDPALIQAFHEGQDIHTAVAAQIHNIRPEEVSREQRSGAKMVNFGIVYGITSFGLARRLGIGNSEAEDIIIGYKKRFAGITTFLEECIAQARRLGYVETMLKRRRPIPDIESNIPSRRSFGERTAINSVVQGSAADLIKLAMVDLHRLYPSSPDPRSNMVAPDRARMLLQIHDELVFESPVAMAEEAKAKIVETMEKAMTLAVPLKADASIATNWFEGK